MYNVTYSGFISVAESLGCVAIELPFSVITNGPVTEASLKAEVLKNVPLCYTCIHGLNYNMTINNE